MDGPWRNTAVTAAFRNFSASALRARPSNSSPKNTKNIMNINEILISLGLKAAPSPKASYRPSQSGRDAVPPDRVPPKKFIQPRKGCDLIGMIGFHDKAFVMSLPAEPWGDKLIERVGNLPGRVEGAGTNIAAALRLALELTKKSPPGTRKRIWLFSDGDANQDTGNTEPAAQAIADANINLNVIAFGEAANSTLLKTLAAKTHHGRFIPVASLHEMAAALKNSAGAAKTKQQHRQEVAILCVDCSPSMNTRDMGNQRRIEAVRDAIRSLLTYKASVWS